MAKQIINPPTVAVSPVLSQAIKKAGHPVFIAGQVSQDAEGNIVGKGDIDAQVEQVFTNLQAVVEAAGGTLEDIVKITVFMTDLAYRPAITAGRLKYFADGERPAGTSVVVTSLASPDYLVEIEAVAMIDQWKTAKDATSQGAKRARGLLETGIQRARSVRKRDQKAADAEAGEPEADQ